MRVARAINEQENKFITGSKGVTPSKLHANKKARARESNRSFGNYTSICTECLNKLRKQQIIDERLHNQKLMENTVKKLPWDSLRKNEVVDGGLMIGKKTGEILGSVADYTFLVNIN